MSAFIKTSIFPLWAENGEHEAMSYNEDADADAGRYVQAIADILMANNSDLGNAEAIALSWAGLDSTKAFDRLNNETKDNSVFYTEVGRGTETIYNAEAFSKSKQKRCN